MSNSLIFTPTKRTKSHSNIKSLPNKFLLGRFFVIFEYSMSTMTPTPYGDPYNSITNPDKQMVHKALGDYGPLGTKYSTEEFLQIYK